MQYAKVIAVLAVLTAAACNTVEGAGEDVRAAGGAIDKSAEENNTYGKY
tara:strand:- start:507 stop:653 length:147 start_codon:yes stop_codon:yes gene_type:complete